MDFRQTEEVLLECERIRSMELLPLIPRPICPLISSSDDVDDAVARINDYIQSFEYNYNALPFIQLKRSEKFDYLLDQTAVIMQTAYPIQCVEAVFLGAYLTLPLSDLLRVPLSFKSCISGKVYRHIVLAVRHPSSRMWGALGISRRQDLAYRPMESGSLSDVVAAYRDAYAGCRHHLMTVYVGGAVPHVAVDGPVKWRMLKVRLYKKDWRLKARQIDQYAAGLAL